MCRNFTNRQWTILIPLYSIVFCVGLHCSLFAPFYPRLAISKGTSATIYGLILGVFELVVLISAPCFGKYVGKIGVKTLLNCGTLTLSTFCILFGFLDVVLNETMFVVVSFTLRTMAALGYSAYITSLYTIFSYEFTNILPTIMVLENQNLYNSGFKFDQNVLENLDAINESLFGIGLIIGPVIGGFLYELDGFSLPFLVVGGLSLLASITASTVLPAIENAESRPLNVLPLLKILPIGLNSLVLLTAAVSVGFTQALLAFNLRPSINSLVFIVNGASYGLSNFGWSYAIKKNVNARVLYAIGGLTIIFSFSLLGPASFIPIKPKLWIITVALVLHGIGVACQYLVTFIDCNQQALLYGHPDNIETKGLITGLWVSVQCTGLFFGQFACGFLYDEFGFENAVLVVIGLELIVIVVSILYNFCYSSKTVITKL